MGPKMIQKTCAHCGDQFWTRMAEHKVGRGKFCGQACSGLSRRVHKTLEQKRAEKAAYDRKRRAELGDELREQKREAYYRNHSAKLARQAEIRSQPGYAERMRAYGREYRKDPAWKAHKKQYDRRHRAEKQYGDFADAAVALRSLQDELKSTGDGNAARQYERGRTNRCNLNRRDRAKED